MVLATKIIFLWQRMGIAQLAYSHTYQNRPIGSFPTIIITVALCILRISSFVLLITKVSQTLENYNTQYENVYVVYLILKFV